MDYKETLDTIIKMHENIINKYGNCRNSRALEKAISLLSFIIENDK